MVSRKSIKTVLFNGERRLASRKNGHFFNWINHKVAETNATKYSQLLGQPVEVKSYQHGKFTVYYLVVENFIP